ncbi:NUDIX hydrolase [Nesterenkonia sp.]|uniref:NUDIX domain-containing protein n=1 Tax=Nesterenkonia sp. TaxID=704201 RepID=UPI0026210EEC|nr:NUDIX hydrolase [Nesterenkonia sp.]
MHIQDTAAEHPVTASRTLLSTGIFDVAEESFRFGDDGEQLTRVFVQHPGAVAVVAVDVADRVLLINQYRHPVRMNLWEVPAGLLDIDGEPMLTAAQRELHEEADITASTWHTLVDFYTTPGAHNEAIRIYLAEGIDAVPESQRHARQAEEAQIQVEWVPLAEAVAAVLAGQIHNPSAALGILALHAVRSGGAELRAADAPWPQQPRGIAP